MIRKQGKRRASASRQRETRDALIPTLNEHEREPEVRRQLGQHFSALSETLRLGADVGQRLPRLKALNIIRAAELALGHEGQDVAELDALDLAACKLIDRLGELVPVASPTTRLRSVNTMAGQKRALLDKVEDALNAASIAEASRRDDEVRQADIDAQFNRSDLDAPLDAAWQVAGAAMAALVDLLLRDLRKPVLAIGPDVVKNAHAVARAVRYLLDSNAASAQNVAFVTLYYFGLPWEKRKNYFKHVEIKWERDRDAALDRFLRVLVRRSREG